MFDKRERRTLLRFTHNIIDRHFDKLIMVLTKSKIDHVKDFFFKV